MTWNFIRYVAGYRRQLAPRVRQLIASHAVHAQVVVLRNRRAVRRYLPTSPRTDPVIQDWLVTHGAPGGVECLPDPFDQPLHVRDRRDTPGVDPVYEAGLARAGIAGCARHPNTRVVPARRLARLAKVRPLRPHIEEDISRNQDNVTGKLRQVSLHYEGMRCSNHSGSQTLIRRRGQSNLGR
jgi:hypothetical protein